MRVLYVLIVSSMLVLGCNGPISPSPMQSKYPIGSVVEHNLNVKGTVHTRYSDGVGVSYRDNVGIVRNSV